MKEPGAVKDISSYIDNLRTLNSFSEEQAKEFGRLEKLRTAELAKIGQLVSDLRTLSEQQSRTIYEAQEHLETAGIPGRCSPQQPPNFNPNFTASDIADVLNPITASVVGHATALPRLHARHVGLQRDMVILPLFALGLLLCLFLAVFSNPVLGFFYVMAGGGLAAVVVQALGGGWTFRRLGGQDFSPRRPGQTAGKGSLAAFLVFSGLVFSVWGLFSLPTGFWGLILGVAMLVRPALRMPDVLGLDEQAVR